MSIAAAAAAAFASRYSTLACSTRTIRWILYTVQGSLYDEDRYSAVLAALVLYNGNRLQHSILACIVYRWRLIASAVNSTYIASSYYHVFVSCLRLQYFPRISTCIFTNSVCGQAGAGGAIRGLIYRAVAAEKIRGFSDSFCSCSRCCRDCC